MFRCRTPKDSGTKDRRRTSAGAGLRPDPALIKTSALLRKIRGAEISRLSLRGYLTRSKDLAGAKIGSDRGSAPNEAESRSSGT